MVRYIKNAANKARYRVTFDAYGEIDTIERNEKGRFLSSVNSVAKGIIAESGSIYAGFLSQRAHNLGYAFDADGATHFKDA